MVGIRRRLVLSACAFHHDVCRADVESADRSRGSIMNPHGRYKKETSINRIRLQKNYKSCGPHGLPSVVLQRGKLMYEFHKNCKKEYDLWKAECRKAGE